jgi:hypothetical protein
MRPSSTFLVAAVVLAGCGGGAPAAATPEAARARAEAYLARRCEHLGAAACAAAGYQGMRRDQGVWSVDYCVDRRDIAVMVPDGGPVELGTMWRETPCPPSVDE